MFIDWKMYYGLNICVSPSNTYIETLILILAVFGNGASKKVKLNEVIRVGPWSYRISAFIRRGTRESGHALSLSLFLSPTSTRLHGTTDTKETPHEDIVRNWPSASQKWSSQNKPNLLDLDLETLASRTIRK